MFVLMSCRSALAHASARARVALTALHVLSSSSARCGVLDPDDGRSRRALRLAVSGDRGQTTAEYALVLIGAAALALLLITWASKSDAIGKLFDFVISHITGGIG